MESVTYKDALQEALCFGYIDTTAKTIDADAYMQRWVRRKPSKSKWSFVNQMHLVRLMRAGKMHSSGLRGVELAQTAGLIDARFDYTEATCRLIHAERSAAGLADTHAAYPDLLEQPLPEPFRAALHSRANRAARRFWDTALAPSYKKKYIWSILQAKRADTKTRRTAAIMAKLADKKKQ
jgi:uncharacterized protein YdeI (YjbR/CyaY-like superfamily)